MLPAGQEAAEAFYRVVDAAYERRSVAVTSNLHPSGFAGQAASRSDLSLAGSAAMADGLKPLAISQTARDHLLQEDGKRQDDLGRREGLDDTEHDQDAGQHERRDGHKAPG